MTHHTRFKATVPPIIASSAVEPEALGSMLLYPVINQEAAEEPDIWQKNKLPMYP